MPTVTCDRDATPPDDRWGFLLDRWVIDLDELNSRGDSAGRVVPAQPLRPQSTDWGRM